MTDLLLSDSRAYIQDILAWAVCIAALVWGAGPERAVALVWLVLFEVAHNIYRSLTGTYISVDEVDAFSAVADSAALICWIAIALYANRNYTLLIAAMQVLAMTAHLARGLVEAISPVAYVTMVAVPGWLQLLLLALGLGRHVVRKRRFGEYRDWRVGRGSAFLAAKTRDLPGELSLHQAPEPTWRDDLK
ncbi:hypothetical protein INR77_15375 [Erythrobacter sp. SCSIO 43205]|uniref:hypothetical protein n=1 Tax=Erythrobacter sp. SCSIO 43205 TaxID=2779361 RepID=UPI001CA91183|nr:hypothetical protein [Erythrobacter sp. SCSIO 43205]UAB78105.1 hypothetical protein INR77_15375 [Erythrobacter sp. SCSIO 43205]